jgi:anti-anti-sigma factor
METELVLNDDGSVKLIVAGEIDVSVAHELAAVVEKACAAQPPQLVIDLAAVSFCDSSGIAQFVLAAQQCENIGSACRIENASPIVRRVFDGCGLNELLDR